jgi:hypothetical protein
VVLRTAIKLGHCSAKVDGDGQFGFRIANAQYPSDRPTADEHPIHITSRTVDADVIQGGESLTAEKVNCADIDDELLGRARVPLDEIPERLAIRGVDVT